MNQLEMGLLGSTSAPRYQHPASEIRICRDMADAVWLALRHARMTQEALADRIGVSASYMSLLLNGKRPWQQRQLEAIRRVTGSLATLQLSALREGVELYADPVETRKAALKAELAELERAA